MDASSVPAGRAQTIEAMDSYQGGAVDTSSAPAGKIESDSGASGTSGVDQENGDDPPAVCREGWLTSLVAGDVYPRQYWAEPGVRPIACRLNLLTVIV